MTSTDPAQPMGPLLPKEVVDAVRAGRRFKAAGLVGYRSKGGTYLVATAAEFTDSGQPRDLLAVLPGPIGSEQRRVVPLYIAANPDTVDYLEAQLLEADVRAELCKAARR